MKNLIEHYPEFYKNSPEFVEIQRVLSANIRAMENELLGIFEQCNVNTATWGLPIWEYVTGIETDDTKTDEQRRERVLSKLRGHGTSTVDAVKAVANSFVGGQIEVIEHPDEYAIEIKYIGELGTPALADDMIAAVDEIKPAHLGVTYTYTWLLIRDIHEVKTLTEMEAIDLDKFASGRG